MRWGPNLRLRHNIRQMAQEVGVSNAFDFGFVPVYPPLFCRGIGRSAG